MPLWVAAGLADWWCHRRTSIETTSGVRESAFHLALFAQMGVGVLAVLLLQVNAAILLLLGLLFVLHELTTWAELRFVVARREVRPIEQMIHSLMEILPLSALLLLVVVAGMNASLPDWRLRLKDEPLPPAYLVGVVVAVVLLNVLPLLEEFRRCWRARPAMKRPPRPGGATARMD
ncbi:hypothetical protein FN976_01145 [Caenimonas sedimenti]|uniref:Diguanylate cyclase n=1 Tax=Caenimonas sedimenti TaxID=2596921 RepID=A0A562ZXA4_9BURK|nr:hypothetical protein FN976_01145 [Caenimonas sedimenti]